MHYRLENWAVRTRSRSPYDPPELMSIILSGNVYGHPRFPNGTAIETSRIVDINGRSIETKSGSHYLLVSMSQSYKAFLEKHKPDCLDRIHIQSSNPIIYK